MGGILSFAAGSVRKCVQAAVAGGLGFSAVAAVPMPADRDGDGFPDAWEAAHPGMNPDRANTLQEALDAATDHDTVLLLPGEYPAVRLDARGKSLTLTGADPDSRETVDRTMLKGDGRNPVISWTGMPGDGRLEIAGLSLAGGSPAVVAAGPENGGGRPQVILRGNRFTANRNKAGGAVAATAVSLTLLGNRFEANAAAEQGGAVAAVRCGGLTAENNAFTGNEAEDGGALAMVNAAGAEVRLRRNVFTGNRAQNGAALYVSGRSSVQSENNLVATGEAAGNGGGFHLGGEGTFTSRNDTYAGNRAGGAGGAVRAGRDVRSLLFRNSICWGNAAPSGTQIAVADGSALTLQFSDIQDALAGGVAGGALTADGFTRGGNFSRDPRFAGPADWHLASAGGRPDGNGAWTADVESSPCLDAGSPADAFSREPAPNGNRINMGSYGNTAEASKTPAPVLVVPWKKAQVVEGGRLNLPVRLSACPAAPVSVRAELTAATHAQLRLETAILTFSPENWAVPQRVTVIADKDADAVNGAAELRLSGAADATAVVVALEEIDLDNPALPGCLTDAGERFGEAVAPTPAGLKLFYLWQGSPTATFALLDSAGTPLSGASVERRGRMIRISLDNAPDGPLAIVVRIADGTRVQEQIVTACVDSTQPEVAIALQPVTGVEKNQRLVLLAASEPGARIYATVNGLPPSEAAPGVRSGVSPMTLTVAGDAPVQALAVDEAGNRSSMAMTLLSSPAGAPAIEELQLSFDVPSQNVILIWVDSLATEDTDFRVFRAVGPYETRLLQECIANAVPPPPSMNVSMSLTNYFAFGGGTFYITDPLPPFGATVWYAIAKVEPDGTRGYSSPASLQVPAASAVATTPEESGRRAKEWLYSMQTGTGYWAPDLAVGARYRMPATCQVLRGLRRQYGTSFPSNDTITRAGLWLGLGFIQGQWPENNRYASERLQALQMLVPALEATPYYSLLAAAQYTGAGEIAGWGLHAGLKPDALHTALAKKTMAGVSFSTPPTWAADLFTQTVSDTPGRYGWQPGGPASIMVSALVYGVTQAAPAECAWIVSQQQTNGSIAGTVPDTAAALLYLPADSGLNRTAARDWLIQQQALDGSWSQDPALTGLCLEAIFSL